VKEHQQAVSILDHLPLTDTALASARNVRKKRTDQKLWPRGAMQGHLV